MVGKQCSQLLDCNSKLSEGGCPSGLPRLGLYLKGILGASADPRIWVVVPTRAHTRTFDDQLGLSLAASRAFPLSRNWVRLMSFLSIKAFCPCLGSDFTP